jgi:tetratricopeptide (TPR) repeat protein
MLRLSRTLLCVLAAACFTGAALAQTSDPPSPPVPPGVDLPTTKLTPGEGGNGLTADVFYRILLGEVALQRGEPVLAARAYLEAARDAQDARLARRATEIAIAARQRMLAEEAATLWSKIDPSAERPKQIVAALRAGTSAREFAETTPADTELKSRLERLLSDAALSGQGVGEVFLQLNRLFAQQSDKQAVLKLIRDLAKPYPKNPEAHFAIALAAYNTGMETPEDAREAETEIDRALALRPDWERAALLKAEMLSKKSMDDAVAYLKNFLAAQPSSKPITGALAQFYVDQKRLPEARALMQGLWDREPENRDLEFAVASIALQMKDYAEAERLLLDLKAAGYGEPGMMDLYLAQVAEETKRYKDAIDRYREVTEGDRAWAAKLRIGALMGKMGQVEEAKRYFASLSPENAEQRVQARQSEAQMLRDAGDLNGAYSVLVKALGEDPDASDLIYDLAMVAEKLDRVDEATSRLAHLVELKPDDAQALNALGYTLVDRTKRTNEGYALIEKALKLSPNDPFILDSMGWALYRMGRLDDAESYLKRAFADRPDPEIAAHLGEVLWAKGDFDRARAVWRPQLDSDPDNAVLKETVRRLSP